MTKNINPFSLERKIFDVKNREMIHMFWEDCNEPSFYKHIFSTRQFLLLNGKNIVFPRVAEIVMSYIEASENNFSKLKKKLIENQKIFQFVYTSIYPEVYSFVETRGGDVRNNFHLKLKEWKGRKKYSQKLIDRYFSKPQNLPPTEGVVQKKLVMNEDFEEEKKIVVEQKQKKWRKKNKKRERRHKIAAKSKELKRIKKAEKEKKDEKEMRARLKKRIK